MSGLPHLPGFLKNSGFTFETVFTDYCSDGWFIGDPTIWGGGLHEVGQRFRERSSRNRPALQRDAVGRDRKAIGRSSSLPIFQFSIDESISGLVVEIIVEAQIASSRMQATLSAAENKTHRRIGKPTPLVSGENGSLRTRWLRSKRSVSVSDFGRYQLRTSSRRAHDFRTPRK